MFNVKCVESDCKQADVEYTFLGLAHNVECGGCAVILNPYNEQPDPIIEKPTFPIGGN